MIPKSLQDYYITSEVDLANNYDSMIKFYYSGRLDVARNIRRAELSARSPQENIGGGHVRSNQAPQESLLMKFDEDDKLNQLDEIEGKVRGWISTFDNDTEDILILRYKERCPWWQVADILNISEATAKRRYKDYRDTIERWAEAVNV
jgi:DNA-directed RNA polymerase specialized sigma24 family protein